ncbi:MAG TPA: nuclear transport factor 2 family protein [Sphingomicrobium sp.]|nr:nuclear transport factor 2 family protein [Sphingomicrobium sp.]
MNDHLIPTTRRCFIGAAGAVFMTSAAVAHASEDLEKVTQALADALAPARVDIWSKWTHPDFVLTDENGERIERKQFLAEMRPLPAGASGTIKVAQFSARKFGNLQVATYVLEELEHYHGEELHARYRQTDSWLRTSAGWRLIASQVIALRTDPTSVDLSAKLWAQYVGRYQLPDGLTMDIEWNGNSATMRKGMASARSLKAELADLLFVPGEPRVRYLVERRDGGEVARLIQRRESWDIVWKRLSATTIDRSE